MFFDLVGLEIFSRDDKRKRMKENAEKGIWGDGLKVKKKEIKKKIKKNMKKETKKKEHI